MGSLERRREVFAGVLLGASVLGLLLTRGIPAAVRNLYPGALPVHPYFVPDHAALLYLLLPLACLTAVTVLMLPGVFLVLAQGRDERLEAVVVKGLGVSLAVHFVTTALAKTFLPRPIEPGTFLALIIGAAVVAWGVLVTRLRRPGELRWPASDAITHRRLGWIAALVVVPVAVLLPILFWQDLSPDGFEAIEIGRSLSWTVLPRFLTKSGLVGLGIGMLPMAYPIHWFVMLFGPIEAAARLPIILYLPVLFASLVALIELRSPRRLGRFEEALVVLALAIFVVAMCYSASYSSYFADASSPGAFETLTVTLMFGAAYFLWSDEPWWFIGFAVLSYLARPTGLLFIALLGLGVFLVVPERRRRTAGLLGATIGLWGLVYVGYELLYPSLAGAQPGYAADTILDRFRYLRVDDWHRVIWVVVAGGILPVAALFAVRRQDRIARSLSLATLGYFCVFYFPAFTNLHHFAPIMILPVIIFWRVYLTEHHHPWLIGATLAAGLLALMLSLPRHFEVDRTMRRIGSTMAYRIGSYGSKDFAAHRHSYEGRTLLAALFPLGWDVADPAAELVAGIELVYYAEPSIGRGAATNYVIQPPGAAPPTGFSKIAENDNGAAYVRDLAQWERDRSSPSRTDYRSRVYEIPRDEMSSVLGIRAGRYTIDLGKVRGLWRLF